jgi:hypothetical protein
MLLMYKSLKEVRGHWSSHGLDVVQVNETRNPLLKCIYGRQPASRAHVDHCLSDLDSNLKLRKRQFILSVRNETSDCADGVFLDNYEKRHLFKDSLSTAGT